MTYPRERSRNLAAAWNRGNEALIASTWSWLETEENEMGKLIMWNMVTLDGFFEGPKPWDIDWHNDAWGDELEQISLQQLRAAEMLVFGRKTYEGMASYWPTAEGEGEVAAFMNRLPKVVFSRTLKKADWANTRVMGADAEAELRELKAGAEKDLFIFGSADLSASLMKAGLIDEYRLGVVPIVLGAGSPLFKPLPQPVHFKLVESRPLNSGAVILSYRPAASL